MFTHHQCRIAFVGLIYIFLTLPLGCAKTINVVIDDIGKYPTPIIVSSPINVGVYYRDEFSAYKTTLPGEINVDFGNANIVLFNYILSHAFKKVTRLYTYPDGAKTNESLDVIIIPAIDYYTYFKATREVIIIYELKIYLPEGTLINSLKFRGDCDPQNSFYGYEHSKICKTLTKMAMREVATKSLICFSDLIDIKQIISNSCDQ